MTNRPPTDENATRRRRSLTRGPNPGGPFDHLLAVAAACTVVSEGRVTGDAVLRRVAARYRPDWLAQARVQVGREAIVKRDRRDGHDARAAVDAAIDVINIERAVVALNRTHFHPSPVKFSPGSGV